MAAKKKAKTVPKPEYSIKVIPKKNKKIAPVIAAKKNKTTRKKRVFLGLLTKKARLRYIFVVVCIGIIVICVTSVLISLKHTNDALNQAASTADSLNVTSSVDSKNAKLIGSNEQLTKEIDNYATAPADLQSYALKDYRTLKQKCIVNGQIYGSLSYAIASVADAQFAQIKRNCNGEQTQILKKFGETWTVVHEGNDPPLCSLVNDLMIPQRVSLNCVIGGTMYLNPNP